MYCYSKYMGGVRGGCQGTPLAVVSSCCLIRADQYAQTHRYAQHLCTTFMHDNECANTFNSRQFSTVVCLLVAFLSADEGFPSHP